MNTLAAFIRLARMRRSAGATPTQAACWAAGLLWRDFLATLAAPTSPIPPADPHRRARLERRAEVERAARQRL